MLRLLNSFFQKANERYTIFFWVIFSLFTFGVQGCGGIQLQRSFVYENNYFQFPNIQPPLEKVFETTVVAGFPKDAGTLLDSILFIGTLNGEVKSYNILTGKSYGYFDAGNAVAGAPLVEGNRVVVSVANDKHSLLSYDFVERKTEWKVQLGDIETKPIFVNDAVVVLTSESKLIAVKKYSGEIIWTFAPQSKKKGSSAFANPVSDNTRIYFGNDEGMLYVVDADSGYLAWKFQMEGSMVASPVLDSLYLYCTTTKGKCYSFMRSFEIDIWTYDAGVPLYGSVGVNNEYVFLPSSDGKITALRKREGTKAWEFQTSNGINTAPVATEKNIFFGTLDKNIFALDAKSGKIQWQYSLDGRLKTNLVAKNDCLVAFVEDRTVLVFKKPTNISKGK